MRVHDERFEMGGRDDFAPTSDAFAQPGADWLACLFACLHKPAGKSTGTCIHVMVLIRRSRERVSDSTLAGASWARWSRGGSARAAGRLGTRGVRR